MFEQRPSNATAMEGGSAEFSCTVLSENSSTQVNSVWGVQVPGETELILGRAGVNTSALKDGSTAFVGTPFNSPLTIANVTRSLDGTRVRCLFLRNLVLTSQGMPYAFLTVQCELFNVYTVHYSCCDIKQKTPTLTLILYGTKVVKAGNVVELLS